MKRETKEVDEARFVGFYVPNNLFQKVLEYVKEHGYNSLSEFYRDCIRTKIEEREKAREQK